MSCQAAQTHGYLTIIVIIWTNGRTDFFFAALQMKLPPITFNENVFVQPSNTFGSSDIQILISKHDSSLTQ